MSAPEFDPDAVAHAIRARRTLKVLSDQPVVISDESAARNRPLVLGALRVAGWAPFHYISATGGAAEPWRAYVLHHPRCRALAEELFDWFPELDPNSKLPLMLRACGSLVLTTWIPETVSTAERKPKHDEKDAEHLAAAAAMTQNLLLMCTAHGMGTYWSSGGVLGSETTFEQLGIPTTERLAGAIFIEYPETQSDARTRKPGKLRDKRSDDWIVEVTS